MSNNTKITSDGDIELQFTEGDGSSFKFGNQGDFYISNPQRSSDGRVIIVDQNDRLIINFANDFAGGVEINGLDLTSFFQGLQLAPAGVNTFDVVMDQFGNVYKKD